MCSPLTGHSAGLFSQTEADHSVPCNQLLGETSSAAQVYSKADDSPLQHEMEASLTLAQVQVYDNADLRISPLVVLEIEAMISGLPGDDMAWAFEQVFY